MGTFDKDKIKKLKDNFSYDKDKFKDIEGFDAILEQAITFGASNIAKELTVKQKEEEEKLKTEAEKLKELETKLNALQNQTVFEKELSSVAEENKQLIIDLTNGDIKKLEEVKTKYSNLFNSKPKINLADVLSGKLEKTDSIIAITDKEQLKKMYENGEELSPAQIDIIFS